jgi:hypothetical protein
VEHSILAQEYARITHQFSPAYLGLNKRLIVVDYLPAESIMTIGQVQTILSVPPEKRK